MGVRCEYLVSLSLQCVVTGASPRRSRSAFHSSRLRSRLSALHGMHDGSRLPMLFALPLDRAVTCSAWMSASAVGLLQYAQALSNMAHRRATWPHV